MGSGLFRFIHAGRFHLHAPVRGALEIPDRLRDLLIDAPYQAARRVFDAAIAEQIDFVLLTGDLVDPVLGGPFALRFLQEQFQRLAEQRIPVYWVGGRTDPPEAWPESIPLADNVAVFPRNSIETITYQKEETPLATILGRSYADWETIQASDFQRETPETFCIAATYGHLDPDQLSTVAVDYWALGGQAKRKTTQAGSRMAHDPAGPQGAPDQTGPYGYSLVTVDEQQKIHVQSVACDAVRLHRERIELPGGGSADDLRRLLRERVQQIAANSGEAEASLVWWTVATDGNLARTLREGSALELLTWLREQWGGGARPLWSCRLEAESLSGPSESYYQEDSILGDFLRAVRRYQVDREERLALESFLSERQAAGPLAAQLRLDDQIDREEILRQVTLLGVDWLGGR